MKNKKPKKPQAAKKKTVDLRDLEAGKNTGKVKGGTFRNGIVTS